MDMQDEREITMKKVIYMVGVSSLLFVALWQKTINDQREQQESLENCLSVAMSQTLEEVIKKESYGIENRNEMMAAFLQSMIRKIDREMDLTIKIHELDPLRREMDVEAVGKYKTVGGEPHTVSVRRKFTI